ncbi:MAG TPA: DUF6752 domain-containing protein [Nocardioidaceae bacterium]
MSELRGRVVAKARRVKHSWVRRPATGRKGGGLAQLRRRVAELEREVQENRKLNRRLAELTDLVEEVLLPVGQRDEEKVRALLDEYTSRG